MSNDLEVATLKEKILHLERKAELQNGLPFLYGYKMYTWQHRIFHSLNKRIFNCSANQIGKSSSMIRKCLNIGTNKDLWKRMFPVQSKDEMFRPVIWYLYPDKDTVTREFSEKWVREFLPRGAYEKHPWYGWKKIIRNKELKGFKFNCGTILNFMTYSQNVHNLQSGTVNIIVCDEELPEALYPELNARLFASDGYFYMAFTATRGQEFWRKVIEPKSNEDEPMPDALKIQVSMYDCLEYVDGSKSHWTKERINSIISSCRNANEVKRRVFGRFIRSDGLKYHAFNKERHYVPYPTKGGVPFKGVPLGWECYSGVDIGSGGEENHPSAMCFVALNKDRTKIRVFKGLRMDGIQTTAGDTYRRYKYEKGKMQIVRQFYDWASKDFHTISSRARDHFFKAEKGHDIGEEILNTCFKLNILKIYKCAEHDKLVTELESLDNVTDKRKAKDDFIDAMRYAIVSIPIDWEKIFKNIIDGVVKIEDRADERSLRPRDFINEDEQDNNLGELLDDGCEEEINYWSEQY